MTNPAPAPQPDLHERIAEMFPCICVPRFEDGAHWHDCPTHFREAVEKLVNEFVEAETAAALAKERNEHENCIGRETAALRAKVAVDRQHICETLEEIDTAMGKDRDFAKAIAARVLLLERERDEAREKLATVTLLLDTPEIEEFDKAIPLESAHQINRWGNDHDAGKLPADWFWLVGYLAGKALHSHISGNVEKAKHHCISTAAALRNWHAHIRSGETKMRPGIETPALGAESPRKDAP